MNHRYKYCRPYKQELLLLRQGEAEDASGGGDVPELSAQDTSGANSEDQLERSESEANNQASCGESNREMGEANVAAGFGSEADEDLGDYEEGTNSLEIHEEEEDEELRIENDLIDEDEEQAEHDLDNLNCEDDNHEEDI